jgi:hypothetical protein
MRRIKSTFGKSRLLAHSRIVTIQTGMITSIWAIVDCVVYLADVCPFLIHISCVLRLLEPTGTHLIFNVPLSKLYRLVPKSIDVFFFPF